MCRQQKKLKMPIMAICIHRTQRGENMKKYKVALNVDGIIQVTYTLHAYSADGAVYRSKVKAFDDFGESKFNAVYVVEVKGGENNGRN